MSGVLDKPTNKFYSTLFSEKTALGRWNRFTDPAGKAVADDAIKKTTPITDDSVGVAEPVTMPGADDEAVRRARRRKIASMQARSGRASTILSDSGEAKLGG